MPITNKGWELHVKRLGVQKKGSLKRTYGDYQVYIDGKAEGGLSGHMCETIGPGDNKKKNNGKRIQQGTYPLWTQFGRYRTFVYSKDLATPGASHMPGLLLHGAEPRDGILIHPGHPPSLYLSSIGCFNPTNPLSSDDVMNIWDSRARVIALIESLKGFFPNAFVHETSTHIKGATVIVDGEPKDAVPDAMLKEFASANVMATPASLPVSKKGAKQCAEWMVKNFGAELTQAVKGKPYEVE
ncbi:peptidase S8/S53 subtilisin kexin sedolisin, partial [Rhizobium ruizarguesonis]